MGRQTSIQIDGSYYDRMDEKVKIIKYDNSLLRDLAVDYELPTSEVVSLIGKTEEKTVQNILRYRNEHKLKRERLLHKNVKKNTPYGYNRVNGKLVLNENEISVIRDIVKMHEEGLSYSSIARVLNEKGVLTKTGDTLWRYNVVKRLIDKHNKQVDLLK